MVKLKDLSKDEANLKDIMKMFLDKYDQIPNLIPYNPEWRHPASQYYDLWLDGESAIQLQLAPGEMAKSQHPDSEILKMIFIGTRWGPIVIWGEEQYRKVVKYRVELTVRFRNSWSYSNGLVLRGQDKTSMSLLLGINEENIGFLIEKLMADK